MSPNLARGCRSGMSKSNQSALALCVGIMGSSTFGACLRSRIGSFLPALVAFAATPCDDIGQIIAAVIVGNLGACSDVLDGDLFEINSRWTIDGTSRKNLGRYVNHSCRPNAEVHTIGHKVIIRGPRQPLCSCLPSMQIMTRPLARFAPSA